MASGGIPNSWMVYKGQSQSKMDDKYGYPYELESSTYCMNRKKWYMHSKWIVDEQQMNSR
jgi:hypothetical protein